MKLIKNVSTDMTCERFAKYITVMRPTCMLVHSTRFENHWPEKSVFCIVTKLTHSKITKLIEGL